MYPKESSPVEDFDDRLHKAAHRGDLTLVTYFVEVEKLPVDEVDPRDGTPLYYAAHGGHIEVCRYLLQAGARCDEKTYMGERVFYAALNDNLRNLLKSYSLAKTQAHPFRVHMATLMGKASCGNPSEGGGDVAFVVGGEEIWAHRFVLAGRCSYLGERFGVPTLGGVVDNSKPSHLGKWRDMPIIKIEHESVTPEAFRGLLQWLYTGRVELPAAHVKSFRVLCKRCRLSDVLKKLPDEDTSIQQTKNDGDKVVKMGQLILDDGNETLLRSFSHISSMILRGESLGYDIRIRVPEQVSCNEDSQRTTIVQLHRAVLTTQSPYFSALLTTQNGGLMFSEAAAAATDNIVDLHDMPLPIFRIVVTFLYSGRLELDTAAESSSSHDSIGDEDGLNIETIYNVLEAAEVLLLSRLKTLCGTALAALVTRALSIIGDSSTPKEIGESYGSHWKNSFGNTYDAVTVILDGLEIALRFEIDKLEEHCYDAIAQRIDLFLIPEGAEVEMNPCEDEEDPRIRFEKMIEENAWTVKNRQAADSIPIVDGIKGALADIFRESSGQYDMEGEDTEQIGEYFRRTKLLDMCLQKLGLSTATGKAMGTMTGVLASRDQ